MNTRKMTAKYQPDQHPADYSIPQHLADAMFRNGFEDTSWRNDICASFTLHEKDQCIRIWIESEDPVQRESDSMVRYWVSRYTPDMEFVEDLTDTDDLYEAFGCAIRHKSHK